MNEDFAAGWRTQKTWKCDPQRAVNICESKASFEEQGLVPQHCALHPNELNVKMSRASRRPKGILHIPFPTKPPGGFALDSNLRFYNCILFRAL